MSRTRYGLVDQYFEPGGVVRSNATVCRIPVFPPVRVTATLTPASCSAREYVIHRDLPATRLIGAKFHCITREKTLR